MSDRYRPSHHRRHTPSRWQRTHHDKRGNRTSSTRQPSTSSCPDKVYESDSTSVASYGHDSISGCANYPRYHRPNNSITAAASSSKRVRDDWQKSLRKREAHTPRHHSRPSHFSDDDEDDNGTPASRHRGSRKHRDRRRDRDRSRHRPKALMPARDDDDDDDETGTPPMAVAVREKWPVQTVPRMHRQHNQYPSSDDEEVFDYRPRPMSRRRGAPSDRQRQQHQTRVNDHGAERGFLMAAAMVALSLVVCCGDDMEE